MNGKKIVVLVPMRHHSQRVPEKNFRLLAGKPLYHHIITTLLSIPRIHKVVVDTDSSTIIAGLKKNFPSVIILERPEFLRADTVPMNDILLYDTSQVEADVYLQTHSTNPLLKVETINQAIDAFLVAFPARDSLFSVTRLQTRLWDKNGRAINHDPSVLLQTQDLPPVFEENSCLYMFTKEILEKRHNRLGDNPLMFEMDADEAWDIDDELDFSITEFLMKRKDTV
ncbi:MAG TPA: acylneuraminate cytidylyltransferase family protein [Anaerolineales bacterium]|nr:acylneuraminate cytidylyltransferase family protein [Anaerolineales bacterium]